MVEYIVRYPAGRVTRITPEICSRRRMTPRSCSRSETSTSIVMRVKPSGVLRAFSEETRVLIAASAVDTSMIRLRRSFATTCSAVR